MEPLNLLHNPTPIQPSWLSLLLQMCPTRTFCAKLTAAYRWNFFSLNIFRLLWTLEEGFVLQVYMFGHAPCMISVSTFWPLTAAVIMDFLGWANKKLPIVISIRGHARCKYPRSRQGSSKKHPCLSIKWEGWGSATESAFPFSLCMLPHPTHIKKKYS